MYVTYRSFYRGQHNIQKVYRELTDHFIEVNITYKRSAESLPTTSTLYLKYLLHVSYVLTTIIVGL